MPSESRSPERAYDVCLSFAGEQRSYVEEVASRLRDRGVRVFYDGYEQVGLWGQELYEHLDRVYREMARYCVLFASAEYAHNVWTTHERRSAQVRALTERGEYLLPARFDDTEIPGIRSTVGYIDLRKINPSQFAEMVVAKIGHGDTESQGNMPLDAGLLQTPRTTRDMSRLLERKSDYWEFLCFAGHLLLGRNQLQMKILDNEMQYGSSGGVRLDDAQAYDRCAGIPDEINRICENIDKVFDPRLQEWAFGRPGEPGDEDRIRHLAGRVIDILERLLDQAASLRSAVVSSEFRNAFNLGVQLFDRPISETLHFVDSCVVQMDRIPELLAAETSEPIVIEVMLVLTADRRVNDRFVREFKTVSKHRRRRLI